MAARASIGDQITLVAFDILRSSLLTIDCDAGASSNARLRFPTELSATAIVRERREVVVGSEVRIHHLLLTRTLQ